MFVNYSGPTELDKRSDNEAKLALNKRMENQLPKTNSRKNLVYALLAVLLFAGTVALVLMVFYRSDGSVVLAPDDNQIAAKGQSLYKANCASCHGDNLEGQPNWKSRNAAGLMPAPPHDQSGHTWHHADPILFELTKFGLGKVTGEDYKSDMPVFDGVLSDEEIIAVLSYIKSTWPAEIRASSEQLNRAYVQQKQSQ